MNVERPSSSVPVWLPPSREASAIDTDRDRPRTSRRDSRCLQDTARAGGTHRIVVGTSRYSVVVCMTPPTLSLVAVLGSLGGQSSEGSRGSQQSGRPAQSRRGDSGTRGDSRTAL